MSSQSDNVLKSAILQGDWLIIKLYRDDQGIIRSTRVEDLDCRLPNLTYAEIQYIVFGMTSTDYNNELYGYLQNAKQKTTVKALNDWIKVQKQYNTCHSKPSKFKNQKTGAEFKYDTICTFIRNEIDHPSMSGVTFSEEDLKNSIKLMRELCKN